MSTRACAPVLLFSLLLASCSDGGPTQPAAELDLDAAAPLTAALPDLAPEAGSAGTDRYVPTLGRIFRRGVRVVSQVAGAEAAARLTAEAETLRGAVRTAREAGDTAAFRAAVRDLEGFEARVGVRVFGVDVIRHVHADASKKLQTVVEQLKAAKEAGRDVSRLEAGARRAHGDLVAAREAAGAGRPVLALVHAAHALDLVIRISAAL